MISSIHIASVLSAILMVPALGAGAASRSIIEDSPGGALTAAADPAVRAKLDKLRGRARDEGNLEIIVGVRAPFAPEGYLSARERVVQRRDIAAYQNRVLRALPAVQSTTRNFDAIQCLAVHGHVGDAE